MQSHGRKGVKKIVHVTGIGSQGGARFLRGFAYFNMGRQALLSGGTSLFLPATLRATAIAEDAVAVRWPAAE
jgi:hypothetical protein